MQMESDIREKIKNIFTKNSKLLDTHGSVDYRVINYLTALTFLRIFIELIHKQNHQHTNNDALHEGSQLPTSSQLIDVDWQSISTSMHPGSCILQLTHELGALGYSDLRDLLISLRIEELAENKELCKQIVEYTSTISFDENESYFEIAEATEELILNFANASENNGGDFYTPKSLAELLVKVLDPKPNQTILDPACGTGSLLLAAFKHVVKEHEADNILEEAYLCGQDVNPRSVALAKANLEINGVGNRDIQVGDSLFQNQFGLEFDLVLVNPPIGLKLDDLTLYRLSHEKSANFQYGPPTRVADPNFIQMVISRLNENGRAALLIGLRLLVSDIPKEKRIRQNLIEDDIIEAVITLPKNILPHTVAQPAILLINKNKAPEFRRKIFFVYADKEFKDCRPLRIIEKENQGKILQVIRSKKNFEKFSALTPIDEIRNSDYVLLPSNYVGITNINLSFGTDTSWKTLGTLATVKQGAKLGKLHDGDTPILQGRNLGNQWLSIEDLDKKKIPSGSKSIPFTQEGDILAQRIGGNPKFLLINQLFSGIPVGDTVYIIRFDEVDLAFNRYLVDFLNSESGLTHLAESLGGAVISELRITRLRKLKIPVPSRSVTEFVEKLDQLKCAVHSRFEEVEKLKNKLFNTEDESKFDLQTWSIEAQVLSDSIIQADDISFQIRNFYPHVLAYPYRNLSAVQYESGIYYKEQLRIVENTLAYLGIIGLALVSEQNYEKNENKSLYNLEILRKFWQGGISPGDWLNIGRKAASTLHSDVNISIVESYTRLWFKGKGTKASEFSKLLQELVELKNDHKHDRGPENKYEYVEDSEKLSIKLNDVFKELSVFVKYPIHLVQNIDNDLKTREAVLNTLVYSGDHPGLRLGQIRTKQLVSTEKLYLDSSHNMLVPLYPLISVHYCDSCRTRETYFLDRWEGPNGRTVLKSFERGHTHDNDEVAKQVSRDFNDWLKSLCCDLEQ